MDSLKQLSKNERINLRRERVLAKLQKNDDKQTQQTPSQNDENQSISKQQIKKSRDIVDKTVDEAYDTVDGVRVERMEGEAVRRAVDRQQRDERLRQVQAELDFSTHANKEIDSRWTDLSTITVAQDLYHAVGEQYQRSSTLLRNKDNVIRLLQRELKEKDDEYVSLLAQQQSDVVTVVQRMHEQFQAYVTTCETQLQAIDATFSSERAMLVENNATQIRALFDQRTEMEQQLLTDLHEREERFQQEIHRIRQLDADDHSSLKTTLEQTVHSLEQQLQQMRCTYQLNSARLDYNHSLLEARDGEHKIRLETLRQQTLKLRLQLAAAAAAYQRDKARLAQVDAGLSRDYERVMARYQDLQLKQRHLARADHDRLHDVSSLNQGKALQLARKVLLADRLIHEQVLQRPWVCPIILVSTDAPAVNLDDITAADVAHTFRAQDQGYIQALTKKLLGDNMGDDVGVDADGNPVLNSSTNTSSASSMSATAASNGSTSGASVQSLKDAVESQQSRTTHMRTVLRMIAREGVFLLDHKARARVDAVPERERELFRADCVLQCIGVRDSEDLEELMELFRDEQGQTKHPNDAIKTLRDFMSVRQRLGLAGDDNIVDTDTGADEDNKNGGGAGAGKGSSSKGKDRGHTVEMGDVKRLRQQEREKRLWMRLGNLLGDERSQVWAAAEVTLRKYLTVLEKRATLVKETAELSEQNQQLKVLLQEYFTAEDNDLLQVPPTRVIGANATQRQ